MFAVRVDNRLRVPVAALDKKLVEKLEAAFTHRNPKHAKATAMGFHYTKEPRTYFMARKEGRHLTLPRGGTNRLRAILAEHGLEEGEHWEFEPAMSLGDESSYTGDWVTPQLFPDLRYDMRPHQERIVEGIQRRHQCIVRSPTGSGKTWALLAAIAKANVPALVVMNSSALLKQWLEDIEEMLGLPASEVGVIGGGRFDLRPLTLGMNQSLHRMSAAKWERVNKKFGFFGLDECHMSAANTFIEVVDKSTAAYRVGVSDDETRADRREFLIYDLFGGVEVEVTRDELVSKGIIHDVSVRMIPTAFIPDWYVEIQQARARGEDPGMPDFNRLLLDMQNDDARNQKIAEIVAGCVVKGEQTFVFAHRVDHCRKLDAAFTGAGHRSGLLLGGPEWASDFARNKAQFKAGKLEVAVGTYKAIGTGQNVPSAVCGVAVTPIHTNRQFVQQVKGRLCRAADGKRAARLYVPWDRFIYGNSPVTNMLRWSNDVKVWSDSKWVEARKYLEEHGNKTKKSSPFVTVDEVRRRG